MQFRHFHTFFCSMGGALSVHFAYFGYKSSTHGHNVGGAESSKAADQPLRCGKNQQIEVTELSDIFLFPGVLYFILICCIVFCFVVFCIWVLFRSCFDLFRTVSDCFNFLNSILNTFFVTKTMLFQKQTGVDSRLFPLEGYEAFLYWAPPNLVPQNLLDQTLNLSNSSTSGGQEKRSWRFLCCIIFWK